MSSLSLPRPLFIFLGISSVLTVISLVILVKLVDVQKKIAQSSSEPRLIKSNQSASINSQNSIFVDIQGAVTKPGVFELPESSRMVDALNKSEGFVQNADKYYVAKTFNLAKRLTDEEKIYVPFLEERDVYVSDSIVPSIISLNSASQTQLELLPKIGPVTAKKIINNRPYGALEELITKKVIGEKTFELIKGQVSL